MKRSNFTFLFLFALLSFVSINLGAQASSSSCINEVNISVDAQCGFEVNAEVLGATGPAADAQSIVYAGTGSGTAFPGTGSLTGLSTLPNVDFTDGGAVQYQLFEGPDGTGPMLCWGTINLEVKLTPSLETSYQEVMCSQPAPGIPTLAEVAAAANGECSAPISNITETTSVAGSACEGFMNIRTVTGTVDIDGGKSVITLRIDTIVETPLDTSMVECPIGGPLATDGLKLSCELLDGAYPSPDEVFNYYYVTFRAAGYPKAAAENLAIQRAYPYVDKGEDSVDVKIGEDVVITETIVEDKILIDGRWVLVDVVVKDTTVTDIIETITYPVALPLPKGVTCNLTVKCTDMSFEGCAGPDSKIMRTWQVLDWCNGSIKEHMQWIIVEPEAPEFTSVLGIPVDKFPGAIGVDIAPWTCAGQLALSATADASCAPGLNISWSSTAGVIGSDNVLRGLWLGENAEVTATILTDCGSHGEFETFTFTVIPQDNILPVPVAEDEVNVSLTGDPTGTVSPDGGVAKVFVDAIDAGSHNAGCGEVDACLLLKEEFENPVILGGVHQSVGGKLIYYASGCRGDGFIEGRAATKTTPAVPDIYYVYCKEFVKFCCEDQGENQVALVVTNGGGRTSHSWSTVNVEDKSQSAFMCSQGAVLPCGAGYDPYTYAPRFQSAVCTPSDLEYTIAGDADACGDGADVITWTLDGEVVCQTTIFFDGDSQFNPYEIKWPKHYTGEVESGIRRECETNADGDDVIVEYADGVAMGGAFDCESGDNTGVPVWCQAPCSLIGATSEPTEVEAADACKKIILRWTVIDWCSWDPNTANADDDNDSAYDEFQAVDDEWLGAGEWLTDINTTEGEECEECDKTNAASDDVYFRYVTVDNDGYYTFDQVIKVIDETAPEVGVDATVTLSITEGAEYKGDDTDDCFTNRTIEASVTDMCGDTDLSAEGAAWWIEVWVSNEDGDRLGSAPANTKTAFGTTATMNSLNGGHGAYHLIVWSVRDGCGNIGTATTLVSFVDDKQPTPVCIQDLSTAIMPTSGTVEIWASDYDNGSFDNCSDVEQWFLVDEDGNPTDDQETGTYVKNLLVTCEMLAAFGQGETLVLGLYVSDAQGNIDFCNISLNVNGAAEVCDLNSTAALIGGELATPQGDMVESAEVLLNVGSKDLTSVQGSYAFANNPLNANYDIRAEKNDDYINGISTLDLVLIQKHILGLATLDSPYKLIAADINASGTVTAIDLASLRQLILGVTDKFANNGSWRFVDAGFEFADPTSPFPFKEVLNISNLNADMMDQDFVGVKIGDVSGNAVANSIQTGGNRSAGSLALKLEDVTATAGEIVEVAVSSADFNEISAYQFTMELNGLEFVGAESGSIEVNEANFGLIDANTVTTAWYAAEAVSTSEDLFTMTFRATSDVVLSQALTVSSRVTNAVAYNSEQEVLNVGVEYNTIGATGFALFQNTPNPFEETTQIGFELPVAGTATLSIFDVTGKTISVSTENYGSGYNEVSVSKSDLGTTGVLYYQLESGDFTATKKMIIID